jgi:hypothetical protein
MNTEAIRQLDWEHAGKFCFAFMLVSVLGLWAWNTLSELFNGPVAQYKHIVAALLLLAILRWPVQRRDRKQLLSSGV